MDSATHPPRRDPPGRVKEFIFSRLHWNVLGELSEIEVEDGVDENGTEKLSPFLSHPIAAESIAQPPVSVAYVHSSDISAGVHFYMCTYGFEYKGFLIENTDGRPITVKDVVTGFHDHLDQPWHKQILITYKKNAIPNPTGTAPVSATENTGRTQPPVIFLKHIHAQTLNDRAWLNISTFLIGELGISVEEFWARRKANRLHLG
ncbi:uncharacterized protein EI97DRAFT_433350 [Westerdykella ornata]|uniref:Uncharacterized protein n=1 Tax=Westerdykella ornata TaxID=318751 RepID=A0A6A6JLI6_WESOR|nr:uncharacterized protein EI97DRAFT_433350 [Westerdykella ornata]KAF2276516.1 hypothetical protein EI97DRAFT_433350 [Westerdykella ornata]